MAQRYLSATATSVPSERLFSSAGSIYSDHRNRISAEQAENLLFIKSNFHFFDYLRNSRNKIFVIFNDHNLIHKSQCKTVIPAYIISDRFL